MGKVCLQRQNCHWESGNTYSGVVLGEALGLGGLVGQPDQLWVTRREKGLNRYQQILVLVAMKGAVHTSYTQPKFQVVCKLWKVVFCQLIDSPTQSNRSEIS